MVSTTKSVVPLTSLSHGAGCGCKLPAAALLPIVRGLPPADDERLLVGSAGADDAAVYRIGEDLALVLTIDFFTPIVDDPFQFGQIAAANALSDVYAMGGTPLVAMNVVAFPLERLGASVLIEVLRGGADIAASAGISIVGGHSIDDPEPKYGLSVTGTVHPDRILSNAGGRRGDVLALTKPLGVGAIVTAHKRGVIDAALLTAAVEVMSALNDSASSAAQAAGATAATDVTGFGLLGHLHSLGLASGVGARVEAARVPAIAGVPALLEDERAVSGGSARNRDYAETFASFADTVSESSRRLVCDATTSGGLLVAIPVDRLEAVPGTVIGTLTDAAPGTITVA